MEVEVNNTINSEEEVRKMLSEKIITVDTDYCPDLSDVPLRAPEKIPENFMIVYTSGKDSDDLALSILPDTEYYNDLVKVYNLKVVAKGFSNISLSSLYYGLQHSTRILYKNLVQDLNQFYHNKVGTRFEKDDEILRTELNKLK